MTQDTLSALVFLATLAGVWIIVSVPVYVSARIFTMGRVRFIQAMGATALGPIVYGGVMVASLAVLGSALGGVAAVPALALAFIAWLWIYRSMFRTGWVRAFGIALLSVLVFIGSIVVIGVIAVMIISMTGGVLPVPEPNPFMYPQV